MLDMLIIQAMEIGRLSRRKHHLVELNGVARAAPGEVRPVEIDRRSR
jgi:hypothetical protein